MAFCNNSHLNILKTWGYFLERSRGIVNMPKKKKLVEKLLVFLLTGVFNPVPEALETNISLF